jgi:hypothetical protein
MELRLAGANACLLDGYSTESTRLSKCLRWFRSFKIFLTEYSNQKLAKLTNLNACLDKVQLAELPICNYSYLNKPLDFKSNDGLNSEQAQLAELANLSYKSTFYLNKLYNSRLDGDVNLARTRFEESAIEQALFACEPCVSKSKLGETKGLLSWLRENNVETGNNRWQARYEGCYRGKVQ